VKARNRLISCAGVQPVALAFTPNIMRPIGAFFG
jgi:hypothetical protein